MTKYESVEITTRAEFEALLSGDKLVGIVARDAWMNALLTELEDVEEQIDFTDPDDFYFDETSFFVLVDKNPYLLWLKIANTLQWGDGITINFWLAKKGYVARFGHIISLAGDVEMLYLHNSKINDVITGHHDEN